MPAGAVRGGGRGADTAKQAGLTHNNIEVKLDPPGEPYPSQINQHRAKTFTKQQQGSR